MKVVVQRVKQADVQADDRCVGRIGPGLCAFVAIEHGDGDAELQWMAKKLLSLRLFSDATGRLQHNVVEAGGGLLLVSNFTVAGRVRKGTRPDFGRAAAAEQASACFDRFVDLCSSVDIEVHTGAFGADMVVDVQNDGPVTLVLEKRSTVA